MSSAPISCGPTTGRRTANCRFGEVALRFAVTAPPLGVERTKNRANVTDITKFVAGKGLSLHVEIGRWFLIPFGGGGHAKQDNEPSRSTPLRRTGTSFSLTPRAGWRSERDACDRLGQKGATRSVRPGAGCRFRRDMSADRTAFRAN